MPTVGNRATSNKNKGIFREAVAERYGDTLVSSIRSLELVTFIDSKSNGTNNSLSTDFDIAKPCGYVNGSIAEARSAISLPPPSAPLSSDRGEIATPTAVSLKISNSQVCAPSLEAPPTKTRGESPNLPEPLPTARCVPTWTFVGNTVSIRPKRPSRSYSGGTRLRKPHGRSVVTSLENFSAPDGQSSSRKSGSAGFLYPTALDT
mmetsp:Transcript_46039/g.92922  ORF Transcript_46039/g.92922 Transcript_46039/m.92922 type:complete len:205 (+) Transcript_46039:896-1510(+)